MFLTRPPLSYHNHPPTLQSIPPFLRLLLSRLLDTTCSNVRLSQPSDSLTTSPTRSKYLFRITPNLFPIYFPTSTPPIFFLASNPTILTAKLIARVSLKLVKIESNHRVIYMDRSEMASGCGTAFHDSLSGVTKLHQICPLRILRL